MNLMAYCDYKKMLAYRLDSETALVLVSAVSGGQPGSASSSLKTVTVEHMKKVTKDEKEALQTSMQLEWQSVLTTVVTDDDTLPKPLSARDPEYWGPPVSKVRRLQSEPVSPVRSSPASKP